MADVLIAGVLGAAVFAIFLLYRSHVKHTQLINELRAELTAQKIAALTQTHLRDPTVEVDCLEEGRARRKGHLTLLCGGGVASALACIGDRCQSAWKGHRRLAATVAATTVAVAGTAVVVLVVASGDSSGATNAQKPGATATATEVDPRGPKEPGRRERPAVVEIQATNAAQHNTTDKEGGAAPLLQKEGPAPSAAGGSDGTSTAPSTTPDRRVTPTPTPTPTPDLPGTTSPTPSKPPTTTAPTPKPSPPAPSTHAEVCVLGLPVLGLCLAS
ncbi:hypothetical protein [Streptomyces sp. A1136]|uniref:hypothetical protein n=1 Tax=Streptomyces sp. A1136 TaxID=2563102 RepID=UPI00109EBDF3|nr:hypothetical protein [Streptomyces sp. A1136]THA50832.1 hypothetical protein E6R62_24090 [Streptomyces sp. A1136]